MQTVISVAPYCSQARQTETLCWWNRFIQIHDFMKSQLQVHPGMILQWLPSDANWREQVVLLGRPVTWAPGMALAVLWEDKLYTLPQNSNTFVKPVLPRQCHIRYLLSIWLSSGISLMTNGVLEIFWFRVPLWGKAVVFVSVIHALKSRAARVALWKEGIWFCWNMFLFWCQKWNPAICLGKQWDCRRSFEGVPACWACSGPPTRQHLSQ